MSSRNYKLTFFLFLTLWFVVNLIQAIFTEIHSDEAYYALYGQHLAWGYFDHPPMVALLIKTSSLLFEGNLGVRFMTVLLQVVSLVLIWETIDDRAIDRKKVTLYFLISASSVMFSAYGFITTPDAPLLFFTSLFLFGYSRFVKEESWGLSLLLAIAMAGLVYSKYQAVLVIGLVLLSNIRLLTRFKAWVAVLLAIGTVVPHIYWQISNDYPSFQYHLVGRSSGFQWRFLYEYIPNQLAVFNPFILGAIVFILFRYKPADIFERGLYFMIAGFILFFWVTGLRGHVEPHWTVACAIPMIILLYRRSNENKKLLGYVYKVVFPSFFLLVAFRILLITGLLPARLGFSGKESQCKAIESVAGNLPVVFTGSFQNPSLYRYFTHKEATVISSLESRRTQFDLYQFEKCWNHKPAFVCVEVEGKSKHYKLGKQEFDGFKTSDLQTVNLVKIEYKQDETQIRPGQQLVFDCRIMNPYPEDINFQHKEFPVEICMAFVSGKQVTVQPATLSEPIGILHAGKFIQRRISVTVPSLPAGEYHVGMSLHTCFGSAMNSSFQKINIAGK